MDHSVALESEHLVVLQILDCLQSHGPQGSDIVVHHSATHHQLGTGTNFQPKIFIKKYVIRRNIKHLV